MFAASGATTKPKAAATKDCSHYSKASTTSTLGSESSAAPHAPHDYTPEAATSQDELLLQELNDFQNFPNNVQLIPDA